MKKRKSILRDKTKYWLYKAAEDMIYSSPLSPSITSYLGFKGGGLLQNKKKKRKKPRGWGIAKYGN